MSLAEEICKVNRCLSILRIYKDSYKEKDGVVTVGDVRDLIENIDFIEECVSKQKREIPNKIKRKKFFSEKYKEINLCRVCNNTLDLGDNYCSKCGQRIWR